MNLSSEEVRTTEVYSVYTKADSQMKYKLGSSIINQQKIQLFD